MVTIIRKMMRNRNQNSSVYGRVLEAVNTGEISENTLKQAVGRILTKKQALS